MKKLYYKSDFSYNWKFNKKFSKENLSESYLENEKKLKKDSKWPFFFPCNVCFILIKYKKNYYIEKIVGAAIVNRFPLILALPISKKKISERHLDKTDFIKKFLNSDNISINLLNKKDLLNFKFKNHYLNQIELSKKNIDFKNNIIKNSYLSIDVKKKELKQFTSINFNTHKLFFIPIKKFYVKKNLLKNEQILWKPLPIIKKKIKFYFEIFLRKKYYKTFTNKYFYHFNKNNINYSKVISLKKYFLVKLKNFSNLQISKLNNDEAKWPIFFPSSLGIIGSFDKKKKINFMPCGSTTVVNRYPFLFAVSISHRKFNKRYDLRYSLKNILDKGIATIGVPFNNLSLIKFINYMGNTSKFSSPNKIINTKFNFKITKFGPILTEIPINFGCKVFKVIKFNTHKVIIFKVNKIIYSKRFNNTEFKWSPTTTFIN